MHFNLILIFFFYTQKCTQSTPSQPNLTCKMSVKISKKGEILHLWLNSMEIRLE